MQTYRRFVSYVYQYENGKKAGNRGFIKVEARGNTCSIQIALKGICKDGNGHCKVYGFKREDGLLKGSLLAECPVKTGVLQEQLAFLRNEMGRAGYGLSELSGVIFQGDDDSMYGTQWDDEPMKMENFQPDEANRRQQEQKETKEEVKVEETAREESPETEEKPAERYIEDTVSVIPQGERAEIYPEEPEKQEEPAKPEAAAADPDKPDPNEAEKELEAAEQPSGTEEFSEPEESREPAQPEVLEEPKEEIKEIEPAEAAQPEAPKTPETPAEAIQPESRPEAQVAAQPETPKTPEASATAMQPEPESRPEAQIPKEPETNETSPKAHAPTGAYTKLQKEGVPPEPVIVAEPARETVPMQQGEMQMPEKQNYTEQQVEFLADWQAENPIPKSAEAQEKNPAPPVAEPQIENQMPEEAQAENPMPIFAEPQPENPMPVSGDFQGGNGANAANPPEDEEEPLEILDTTIPISELRRKKNTSNYRKPEVEAANVQEQTENAREQTQPERKDFCPFTDGVLQDCQKISLDDIRLLDPRDQGMRGNRFVQHGYQMFGHLLLARVARNSQYILAVPGMYQQQEKFMADMFGFHNFKYAKRSGSRPACFGYWYRLIYPPKLGGGNGNAD